MSVYASGGRYKRLQQKILKPTTPKSVRGRCEQFSVLDRWSLMGSGRLRKKVAY